jgi:hypothetical protein
MSSSEEQDASNVDTLHCTDASGTALASRRRWIRNATAATAAALFGAAATNAQAAELSLTNRIAELQASEAMAGWVEPEITSRAFMRLSIDGMPAGVFTHHVVNVLLMYKLFLGLLGYRSCCLQLVVAFHENSVGCSLVDYDIAKLNCVFAVYTDYTFQCCVMSRRHHDSAVRQGNTADSSQL